MPRKKKMPPPPMPKEDSEEFHLAVNRALLLMQFVLGKHQVCPVCYCTALIECLVDIRQVYDHEDRVPMMDLETLSQMDNALKDRGDDIVDFVWVPTQGRA